MSVRTFWLEPTNDYCIELRRYEGNSTCVARPYGMTCHDARVEIGTERAESGYPTCAQVQEEDPRWPSRCACGYEFLKGDSRQTNYERLFVASAGGRDGERYTLRNAPPGAMWDASWMRAYGGGEPYTGPDGITLVVRLPDGTDWNVDAQCSNCTRSQYGPKEIDGRLWDKAWLGRTHYCWVRHGDPRTGVITVDKGGQTCAAGGGSIQSPGYHGFLRNGELVP